MKTLLPNETILFKCKKHWAIFIPAIFWLACTIFMLDLPAELKLLAIITTIIALSYFIKAAEHYYYYQCLLTNKRVIICEGWFQRDITEIFLQKIDSLKVAQGISGKLLGYGNLMIMGAAGAQHQFALLDNPIMFRKRIQIQLEKILMPKESGNNT